MLTDKTSNYTDVIAMKKREAANIGSNWGDYGSGAHDIFYFLMWQAKFRPMRAPHTLRKELIDMH